MQRADSKNKTKQNKTKQNKTKQKVRITVQQRRGTSHGQNLNTSYM